MKFYFKSIYWLVSLLLVFMSLAHADLGDGSQVVSTEVVRTTDDKGNVVEKRIVKKLRSRTVVDFEEASIEGKLKRPNAAYMLHGADLEHKHLYRVKSNQRSRVISSYEYLR